MRKGFSLISLALFIIGLFCTDSYPRGGASFGGRSFGGRSSSSFRSSGSSYRSSYRSSYGSSYRSSYRSSYPSYSYRYHGYRYSPSYSNYSYRSTTSYQENPELYFNGQDHYRTAAVYLPVRNFIYHFSLPELKPPAVPYIEKKDINFLLLLHQFIFLTLIIWVAIRNYRKYKNFGRLIVFKRCVRDGVISLISTIFLYGVISIFTPEKNIRHSRIKNLLNTLLTENPKNPEGISYNLQILIQNDFIDLNKFDLTPKIIEAMVKYDPQVREYLSFSLYHLANSGNYRVRFGVQNDLAKPENSQMLKNLAKFFDSDNVIVKRTAAHFIAAYTVEKTSIINTALPVFPKLWVENSDLVICQIGFYFIARNFYKDKKYVVQIIKQLNHPNNTVILSVLKALNYIYYYNAILDSSGDKTIVKMIKELSDKIIPLLTTAGFLTDAANYIGLTKNNNALPLLLKAAKNSMTEEEAQAVAWALGALKKNAALPVLNIMAKNTGKLSAGIAKLAVEYINLKVDKK